jgi:hypothetical protein
VYGWWMGCTCLFELPHILGAASPLQHGGSIAALAKSSTVELLWKVGSFVREGRSYFNVQVPCADSMCWFYVLHLCATSMCRFHVLQLCARTSNVDKTAHGRCPFSWCLSETMSSMSSNLSQCCHRSGCRASPTHDGNVHFHGQHMKFISIELCTSIWFLVTEHDRTKWHWACIYQRPWIAKGYRAYPTHHCHVHFHVQHMKSWYQL